MAGTLPGLAHVEISKILLGNQLILCSLEWNLARGNEYTFRKSFIQEDGGHAHTKKPRPARAGRGL